MNFDRMTTDELKDLMPNKNGWEYKDASLLLKGNREALKSELGIQSSAFANSGGGYLVFGVNDKTLDFQPCQLTNGREPMEETLAKLIQTSVEYALFGAKVYRINFTDDPEKAIFLVAYPDSPKAPHQAKSPPQYYWRTNFGSEPAPHFFLDALRNRPTKAIVDIKGIVFGISLSEMGRESRGGRDFPISRLDLLLTIEVENTSFVATEDWCIHSRDDGTLNILKEGFPNYWYLSVSDSLNGTIRPSSHPLQPDKSKLLPGERCRSALVVFVVAIETTDWNKTGRRTIIETCERLRVVMRPATQNAFGVELPFNFEPDSPFRKQLELRLDEMRLAKE